MRKLLKLAVVAAVVTGVAKVIATQKKEWSGLTEPEVRGKLHTKLDSKLGNDKVDEIADKVVEGMRQKNVLADDESIPV